MSANFFNGTWSDNFPIDYDVAHSLFLEGSILFGILWSVLPICFTLSGSLVDSHSTYIAAWIACWLSFLLVFIGCMVMTKYSEDAGIARQHDYLGPMRVKSTQVYQREQVMGCSGGDSCGGGEGFDNCCFYHEYAVMVELEWGYDWACPQHGKKCVSFDTYEPCTNVACKSRWPNTVCDGEQSKNAEMDTIDCAEMLYRTDLTYPEYNPHDPPGSDWPTWLAFGDCSTCTSRFIVPSDRKIRHLEVVGCLFLFIGLFIWIVILIRLIWRRCRRHEGDCDEDETAVLHPDRATYYGSHSLNGHSRGRIQHNDSARDENYPFRSPYQGSQNAVYSPDFDY